MYLLTEWEGQTGKYLARGHGVRPSYGDFLNSFAMKARAGPYGSYDKLLFATRPNEDSLRILTYYA